MPVIEWDYFNSIAAPSLMLIDPNPRILPCAPNILKMRIDLINIVKGPREFELQPSENWHESQNQSFSFQCEFAANHAEKDETVKWKVTSILRFFIPHIYIYSAKKREFLLARFFHFVLVRIITMITSCCTTFTLLIAIALLSPPCRGL